MDFHSTLKPEVYAKNVFLYGEYEEELEEDDEVFYCELRRQVLLLTAEDSDDEELDENRSSPNMAEARKHGSIPMLSSVKPSGCLYNWSGNKEDYATPASILNLWRTGNGTGVFIPQIVQSRRKNRPRRKKKNESVRTYRQVDKMN
ncbi:uncharacterized protein LOC111373829 [Olea europaea var. sylvestris]|uniref:uncharacterized protein LOC111373829 n=1 Tax=Olea europaea var. sylvestris TaxID=158386 RepID=UPI000C1D5B3F|nr:uncharacterized protein LOC111373829 [Olea europaea var. sylvestris]